MTETAEKLERPGGELASRPVHFFWVVDCSGSMAGDKIGSVNHTIQSVLPDMVTAAADNPNAQLLVRTLAFSTGASWLTGEPVKAADYVWEDLEACGVTDLGKAYEMLAAQLSIPPMPQRALPPVIVLLSDGCPTDDYRGGLDKLRKLPWFKKAVRIAISIGQDADEKVLEEFTENSELILHAGNASMLAKLIKWASTAVSAVSSGASRLGGDSPSESGNGPQILDMDNIPQPDEIDGSDVW